MSTSHPSRSLPNGAENFGGRSVLRCGRHSFLRLLHALLELAHGRGVVVVFPVNLHDRHLVDQPVGGEDLPGAVLPPALVELGEIAEVEGFEVQSQHTQLLFGRFAEAAAGLAIKPDNRPGSHLRRDHFRGAPFPSPDGPSGSNGGRIYRTPPGCQEKKPQILWSPWPYPQPPVCFIVGQAMRLEKKPRFSSKPPYGVVYGLQTPTQCGKMGAEPQPEANARGSTVSGVPRAPSASSGAWPLLPRW